MPSFINVLQGLIRIQAMCSVLRQFTVMCNSQCPDGLYAANELTTSFISPLPTLVKLKDYKVGLESIVYSPWIHKHMDTFTILVKGLCF